MWWPRGPPWERAGPEGLSAMATAAAPARPIKADPKRRECRSMFVSLLSSAAGEFSGAFESHLRDGPSGAKITRPPRFFAGPAICRLDRPPAEAETAPG